MSSIFDLYERSKFEKLRRSGELCSKDLEKYSKHHNYYIRAKVVDFPLTPISILYKLSNDINYLVRINILLNPKCPSDLVEKLANDDVFDIQYYAAKHCNVNENTLKYLSNSIYWRVRESVARNSKTKKYDYILKTLAEDKNSEVSYSAQYSLETI